MLECLAVRLKSGRPIPEAPVSFDGSLDELYRRHMLSALPTVEEVAFHHQRILQFCNQADPLFIIRALTSTTRGDVLVTSSGARFKPSDNSPAWWMHFVAFNGIRDTQIEEAPTHMFEVSRLCHPNINSAGWHVAHIYNAKDRDTDWRRWSRDDLTWRFVRNVHPCNCFYVPRPNWHHYGGDPRVIGFVASRYRERYGDIWEEFRKLVRGEPLHDTDGTLRYLYPLGDSLPPAGHTAGATAAAAAAAGVAASYRHGRFCFRADVIENLRDEDVFEMVTPHGKFRMTKREFYRNFPGVVASRSYREQRIYHYPKLPAIAESYRVQGE